MRRQFENIVDQVGRRHEQRGARIQTASPMTSSDRGFPIASHLRQRSESFKAQAPHLKKLSFSLQRIETRATGETNGQNEE